VRLAGGLSLLLLAALGGCSTPPERIILLPDADGRATAVIARRADQPESSGLVLARPYAQGSLQQGRQLKLDQADAQSVQREFGGLTAFMPPRPHVFTVNFGSNSNRLTPETEPALEQARQALAEFPAGEVIVIGHTDSVGSVERNDALSLERAEVVARLLIQKGVPASRIQRQGRGERDPLVPTADEVNEPRNRRVEIKIR